MPKIPNFKLTPEQRTIVDAVRAEIERDKPELIEEGLRVKAALDAAAVHIRDAFGLLASLRKSKGISLTEVAAATGIAKSTLSKLEHDPAANVTLSTLIRVAEALGHDLQISVSPRPRVSDAAAKRSKSRSKTAGLSTRR